MTEKFDTMYKISKGMFNIIIGLLEMEDFTEVIFSKTIIPEKKYKTKDTKIKFALRIPKEKYKNKKYKIDMTKEYHSFMRAIARHANRNDGYIFESELFEECKSNEKYSLSKLDEETLKKMLCFISDLEIMLDFKDSIIRCGYDKKEIITLDFTPILIDPGYYTVKITSQKNNKKNNCQQTERTIHNEQT